MTPGIVSFKISGICDQDRFCDYNGPGSALWVRWSNDRVLRGVARFIFPTSPTILTASITAALFTCSINVRSSLASQYMSPTNLPD